jgi:hypothetical protein
MMVLRRSLQIAKHLLHIGIAGSHRQQPVVHGPIFYFGLDPIATGLGQRVWHRNPIWPIVFWYGNAVLNKQGQQGLDMPLLGLYDIYKWTHWPIAPNNGSIGGSGFVLILKRLVEGKGQMFQHGRSPRWVLYLNRYIV